MFLVYCFYILRSYLKRIVFQEVKELLLALIDSSQVNKLPDIVKIHDPQAFVIFSAARELLGNGF